MVKSRKGSIDDRYVFLTAMMSEWFSSSAGRIPCKFEIQLLREMLLDVHGNLACSVGLSEGQDIFSPRTVVESFALGSMPEANAAIRSSIHHWPVRSGILDIVVLHHVLEWTEQPHRILREACRVLAPGGVLIILGFNPISLNNICRFFPSPCPRLLCKANFYSVHTIKEWLSVLGFTFDNVNFAMRLAPFRYALSDRCNAKKRKKNMMSRLPVGSIFTLTAIKERGGLITDRGGWNIESKPIIAASYARLGPSKDNRV